MLSGDNSILQRATDAKIDTEKASIIEQARTDILGQIAENKGENISDDQLKTILNKYFEGIDDLEFPNDLSNSNIKLKATQTYGGYENIELSDIYNGTITVKQKIPTAATVVQVGDFVNYSVGNWTNNDIEKLGELYVTGGALPSSSTPFKFGGFTTSTSKDTSIAPYANAQNTYSQGWRVLSKTKDSEGNDIINIIHAGTPEGYYHYYHATGTSGYNGSYKSEYIFSGTTSSTDTSEESKTSATYYESQNVPVRDWSMYENSLAISGSARSVTYDEILNIIPYQDSLRAINVEYWCLGIQGNGFLHWVKPNGVVDYNTLKTRGVRPVVSLKSTVIATAKEGDTDHITFETAWQLSNSATD